jgi:hypothetical protein
VDFFEVAFFEAALGLDVAFFEAALGLDVAFFEAVFREGVFDGLDF